MHEYYMQFYDAIKEKGESLESRPSKLKLFLTYQYVKFLARSQVPS